MFCSKCGRQINNDALFCTFCGSPTMLAAPTAPAAPAVSNANALNAPNAPSMPNVPTPQSIPMTSESYAAGASMPSVEAVSQSVPLYAEHGSEPLSSEEEYAEPLPMAEEPVSENPENAEPSVPFVSEPSEYRDDPEAQPSELEQPYSPAPQPTFAVRESSSELTTSSPAGTIDFSAPIQPTQPAPPAEESGKRYTFGHIALCLAAVGVMAIVAGIFAGLYFSVI
ncbi:MAG: zinc-ribbon domain-containing protein [Oscillospiraceae bacterium]|nr:zinc-ribbon domain-containing protein [Oscillospiraceae bacterium]